MPLSDPPVLSGKLTQVIGKVVCVPRWAWDTKYIIMTRQTISTLFYFVASQFGIEWDSNHSPCKQLLAHPKLLLFSAACRRGEWVITMKGVISLVSVSKPLITDITAVAKLTVVPICCHAKKARIFGVLARINLALNYNLSLLL